MFSNEKRKYEAYRDKALDILDAEYNAEKIEMPEYLERAQQIQSFEEFLNESIDRSDRD